MDAWDEKWQFILQLDDELLQGGAYESEWTAFLIRDADTAYCAGANLSAIFCSLAAIEAHLRDELKLSADDRTPLAELINRYPYISGELAEELQVLRRFRNQWVHVRDPTNDQHLVFDQFFHEKEIEGMAKRAIRAVREVVYSIQFV